MERRRSRARSLRDILDSDSAADQHLAAARLLEAAGDRQQRALARSARSHHRHQLAGVDPRSTSWRACTSVGPSPYTFDTCCISKALIAVLPTGAAALARQGQRRATEISAVELGSLEAAVGRVQPPHHRIQPEQLGVDDQGERQIVLRQVLLEAGPLLHQLDQVPAMDLDHLVHVDAGHPAGPPAP